MSTLFVNTIKPDSGSNILISSSLTVSESLKVAGDFELSGSIKLGNADTDSIGFVADVSSSILPDANEIFDLGSTSKKWRHLHAVGITASGDISSSGTIYAQDIQVDNLDLTNQTFTSITASGDISTSGAYYGDGSNLTGVGISGSALDVINITASHMISCSSTGSFEHLVVSGDISGNLSASGTGSFIGGISCSDATGSFGYIDASGDITAAGTVFAIAISSSGVISGSDFVASGSVSSSGTGSFEHFYVSGDVSGSISASGTGSFYGGIVAIDATGSFGYISASGDISTSNGTGSFENLKVQSHTNLLGDITASGIISSSGKLIINDIEGGIAQNGLTITGNITASADISSSGEITTNTFSTTHNGITLLTIDSGGVLSSSADIRLNTGSFFHGDGRMLTNITTSAAVGGTNTQVLFNDGGSVGGDAGMTYVKTTDTLTLGKALVAVEVSASRISASAGFEADGGSTSLFGIISCSGDISSSGRVSASGGFEADGGSTSSFGYISCSGEITVSGLVGVDGSISASGTISGSLLKGQSIQAQVGNNLGYRFNLNNDTQINGVQYNTIGERAHLQIPSLPTSVTLPFSASSTALVGGALTVGGATTIAGATTTNGTLNVASTFQIGGVAVTATAVELNKMDGFNGTTDQLNALIKTEDSDIEAEKSVNYDANGAIKFKSPKAVTTVALTPGDSGTRMMPIADSAQTFTLPDPTGSSGVHFDFMAGSAVAHIITCPTNKIQGKITDYSNGTTLARTTITNKATITLSNPAIGDHLIFESDGDNWYVSGELNDTPELATV